MFRVPLDSTLYPSPTIAAYARAETLAYVALSAPARTGRRDGIGVVDTQPGSPTFGTMVGRVDFPHGGNELQHFGWNACSSRLCPQVPNGRVERRFLVVPGTHSSRIHVVDTRPDPRAPRLVKVIEGEEVMRDTGYAAPHAVRCGPDGIYVSALGAPDGGGPGGIFTLDHETFAVRGAWEAARGPQRLSGDLFWHLGHDTMITSEWGTPNMVRDGLRLELLLEGRYGRALHVWDLRGRTHEQTIDLGAEQQMVRPLRPAHDPRRTYGFVGVVLSLADLSSSVFCWYFDRAVRAGAGAWKARKVITIQAQAADRARLPAVLQPFGAVPPLITDISLSVDDRWLYVSCWGTGELRRYDVSDPLRPALTGAVRLGGIVRRAAHPGGAPLDGGPQTVEVSRDGRRVYVTNSLYTPWDEQFYPDGLRGWMARLEARADGTLVADPAFLVRFEEGLAARQVRLGGGDASSDSYCFA